MLNCITLPNAQEDNTGWYQQDEAQNVARERHVEQGMLILQTRRKQYEEFL